jgi:hypothetical protein
MIDLFRSLEGASGQRLAFVDGTKTGHEQKQADGAKHDVQEIRSAGKN